MRYLLLIILISWNCTNIKTLQTPSELEGIPKVGFNMKASYQMNLQLPMADSLFSLLTENALAHAYLRIPGGALSQKEFAQDWPDYKMKMWTKLQDKYGMKMVYVVNGNDSPSNQLELIRRWQKNGAKIELIEMMSEYYLPKYANGMLDNAMVTRKVTAVDYTDEILPEYYLYLDSLNLPYYLIFAPEREHRDIKRLSSWNDHMVKYVNQDKRQVGAVLHLYRTDPEDNYDYTQISRLRSRLPEGTPIAVTEFGILNDEISQADHAALSIEHAERIVAQLGENDLIMDQVLYNDYPKNYMGNINPRLGGITTKGVAIVDYYNQLYP